MYVFHARFQQKFYFYDPGDQIEQKLETTEHQGSVRTNTWMGGGGERRCYHLWFTKDFDIKIPQFDIMIKVGLMIQLKQLLQGLFKHPGILGTKQRNCIPGLLNEYTIRERER